MTSAFSPIEMQILFVSTVAPFPPTNGVKIPAANHLRALKAIGRVDLLLLERAEERTSDAELAAATAEASTVTLVKIRRSIKASAIGREVFSGEPFYGGWEFEESLPADMRKHAYDLIWCGTAPAVAMFARDRIRSRVNGRAFVAGLSDLHSLVIWNQAKNASHSTSVYYKTIIRVILMARWKLVLRAEMRMLCRYDCVTMQTVKELDWVLRYGSQDVSRRSVVVSNGVCETLFNVPMERKRRSVLFVATLQGLYEQRLRWLLREVWPIVQVIEPDVKLVVVGKGASAELRRLLAEKRVEYHCFVNELCDVYREHPILVAPIFKGFGLINKVVEAMAAGCLVVGDRTAFNGIGGFVPGVHGEVGDDKSDMAKHLVSALTAADFKIEKRERGRRLIQQNFGWEDRYRKIQSIAKGL